MTQIYKYFEPRLAITIPFIRISYSFFHLLSRRLNNVIDCNINNILLIDHIITDRCLTLLTRDEVLTKFTLNSLIHYYCVLWSILWVVLVLKETILAIFWQWWVLLTCGEIGVLFSVVWLDSLVKRNAEYPPVDDVGVFLGHNELPVGNDHAGDHIDWIMRSQDCH